MFDDTRASLFVLSGIVGQASVRSKLAHQLSMNPVQSCQETEVDADPVSPRSVDVLMYSSISASPILRTWTTPLHFRGGFRFRPEATEFSAVSRHSSQPPKTSTYVMLVPPFLNPDDCFSGMRRDWGQQTVTTPHGMPQRISGEHAMRIMQ